MAQVSQITVKDSAGVDRDVATITALVADGGQATIGITSGAKVITDANGTLQQYLRGLVVGLVAPTNYEKVAASQTAQVLGSTGATGDYISGLLVTPATASPGAVTLLDNATSLAVFTGGSSSVSNLVPFFIPLGIKSVSGAWKVTTGADVSVIGIGSFT